MWGEITCIYNVNCPIWNIIGTFPPIRDILWYMNCTMQHPQLAMPTSQQIPTFNLGNYYQNISPMSGMIMMIHWQRWSGYNNNAIKCEYDIIMKMHDYDYEYNYSENKCNRLRVQFMCFHAFVRIRVPKPSPNFPKGFPKYQIRSLGLK